MPHFRVHQPAPPSSPPPVGESPFVTRYDVPSSPTCSSLFSPPVCESSFVTCHVSELTNPLLPLPLQFVNPRFKSFVTCHVSKLTNPAPLSSSPPGSESSFVTCHVSEFTNPLLPILPSSK